MKVDPNRLILAFVTAIVLGVYLASLTPAERVFPCLIFGFLAIVINFTFNRKKV